ncbi:MAG: SURF1 family protein [Devosia sp.]|nr:SURF1 family protein [Devosia sp.]
MIAPALAGAGSGRRRWLFWSFVVLMVALTVVFAGLGKWQIDRLAWKESLLAEVQQRLHLPPVALPPVAEWVAFDPETYQYRPVTLTGHFVSGQAVRVFVGLSDAKGQYSGPGYWIMTPFALDGGGTVFVDRGFVPDNLSATYANDNTAPAGTITLSGIAMPSEAPGPFTPGADAVKRIEWVRNIDRMAKLASAALQPFAPIYVDLPAGPAGALPQGGETTIDFPNNHLGYALTWFGFAILTPIMLAVWVLRQRRKRSGPPPDL